MSNRKILYIVAEIAPFLQVSSLASIAKRLVKTMAHEGNEVRVIMPKFGVINERTNRIHEVQRLCGINIVIEEENISLLVKVGPIREARVQVYFIDNEDLFHEKKVFRDEEGSFYPENDTRIAFICKSVLTIIDYLGWFPDIVHCMGWFWGFVPMYAKLAYKMPLLKKTKFLYTYGPEHFTEQLGSRILQKANMSGLTKKDFTPLGKEADIAGFLSLAKAYSDYVTYSFSETTTPVLPIIKELNATPIPDDEALPDNYKKLYEDLLNGNPLKSG